MIGANGEVETVLVLDSTKKKISSFYSQTTVIFLEVSDYLSDSNTSAIHTVEADWLVCKAGAFF